MYARYAALAGLFSLLLVACDEPAKPLEAVAGAGQGDFNVCQRPDGTRYGIGARGCRAGDHWVSECQLPDQTIVWLASARECDDRNGEGLTVSENYWRGKCRLADSTLVWLRSAHECGGLGGTAVAF